MLGTEFKSVDEINKAYSDHLDSLRTGGFLTESSENALMGAWKEAVENFEEALTQPRWSGSL